MNNERREDNRFGKYYTNNETQELVFLSRENRRLDYDVYIKGLENSKVVFAERATLWQKVGSDEQKAETSWREKDMLFEESYFFETHTYHPTLNKKSEEYDAKRAEESANSK